MYPLDTCVWELTRRCNFSCAYCGSRAGQADERELSLSQCFAIAEQLVDMKCRRVVLLGGEVFFKKGWKQITSYLVDCGVDVSIITNGFMMNERLIWELETTGILHICISIDGTEQVHDRFRSQGSFARAVETIRMLKERGFLVSVISTLNRQNVESIPELYEVLKGLHIDAWQLQACAPFGNASDKTELVLQKPELWKISEFVAKEAPDSPFPMGIADNIGYFSVVEKKIRGVQGAVYAGCSAGISTIGLDSIGNVRGCESLYDERFIEGNLLTRSLRDIWEDPDAFAYNRKFTTEMLEGACAGCPEGDRCAGGCRSMNYFSHGKLYESLYCLKNEKL